MPSQYAFRIRSRFCVEICPKYGVARICFSEPTMPAEPIVVSPGGSPGNRIRSFQSRVFDSSSAIVCPSTFQFSPFSTSDAMRLGSFLPVA